MAQDVTQSVPANLIAIITNSDGTPALGLSFSAVLCSFMKAGDIAFTPKTLTALNFAEVGGGVYTVLFSATDLDTLGAFTFIVSGAGLQQFIGSANVVLVVPIPTPISLPTSFITGHIQNTQAHPVQGAGVSARVIGEPTILANVVGVTDDLVTTTTDANGFFMLELARLAVVDIFIPSINYRRRLTVPNAATTDLFLVP